MIKTNFMYFFVNLVTRKFKSTYVAGTCVSHSISVTQHCSRGHFLFKLLTVNGPSQAVTSPMISKSEVVYYKLPGAET